jgi:hypothetical protein
MTTIRHKQTGVVLFRLADSSLDMANLTHADLRGAGLAGEIMPNVYLRHADLPLPELLIRPASAQAGRRAAAEVPGCVATGMGRGAAGSVSAPP